MLSLRTDRSDLVADVLLLVLVVVHLPHAERVPDLRRVPQPRVEDALHRVPGHVGRRQGEKTWNKDREIEAKIK